MRSLLSLYCTGCCIYASAIGSANAQQTIDLYAADTPIFSEHRLEGDPQGYSIEFATAILRMASLDPNIKPAPFARLMKKMESGELMLATGIGRTPQREDKFFWLTPITANVVGLYGKQKIDLEALSRRNARINVAVLRGDYRAELGRAHPEFVMHEFNTWAQTIEAVQTGRMDAVFFSEFGVSIICRNAGLDCKDIQRQYTHDVLYSYIAMPKTEQNRALATLLSEKAKQFVRSPDFDEMVARWMPAFKGISHNVDEVEGVITLGKIEEPYHDALPLWVITNLEPLFTVEDERGNLTGYAVELVKRILMEAGQQPDILTAPWQRIFVESALKPNVLVFSLVRTEAREDQFHWITPITQNAYSVFSLDHNTSQASDIDSLPEGSRISVLKGDFRQDIIKAAGHVTVKSESWADAIRELVMGRADYLFFSDGGLSIICEGLGNACDNIEKRFVHQQLTTYLALSKPDTNVTLLNKLKASADTFKQSPQYARLVEHWLATYAEQSSLALHEKDGTVVLGKAGTEQTH